MSTLINVYKYSSTELRAVIDPDENSNQDIGIMRGDTLNISFVTPSFIDFQIGDYCKLDGIIYRLNRDANWNKVGKRNWEFSLVFEGPYHQPSRVQFLGITGNNQLSEGKFSFTGRAVDFIDLIILNMARVFPNDNWVRGVVLDSTYQTKDIDGENCLQVLSELAELFNTEFLINGSKISLIQTQTSSGVTLEYGKNKALWGVTKENQDNTSGVITRLYVYGSDKNLGTNYRNGAPRLRLAEKLYLEKNVNRFGIYEATVVFDGTNDLEEIKPERLGTVTSATAINTFSDNAVNFNVNDVLMPGVTAKLTFNSGLLAGVTFEIHSFDFATKTFVINPNTENQTVTLPNNNQKPGLGDNYVLTDIIMPLSYVNDAESRLKIAGQKYLDKKGPSAIQFTVACNTFYFWDTGTQLNMGSSYNLSIPDANIQRPIRLMGYNRSLRNRFIYNSLTLADTVVSQLPLVKILKSI